MGGTQTQPGGEVIAVVSGIAEGVFAGLKPLLAAAETMLTDRGVGATSADLERLRPQVVEQLTGLVVGAGFIAASGVLADPDRAAGHHPMTSGAP